MSKISGDTICTNCGKPYGNHYHGRYIDDVYCYEDTNGDFFTTEPTPEMIQEAEIARLREELEAMTLERNTYRDRVEDLKLAAKSGLELAKGSKETEDKLRQENKLLRLAMGVQDRETVESSGHGWVRVATPGGDLRRISPIDERVIELEQENERLRKDAERLDWSEERLMRIRQPITDEEFATTAIEWIDEDGVVHELTAATLRAAIDAAKEAE